jgi:BlaI family penicillinase repressor
VAAMKRSESGQAPVRQNPGARTSVREERLPDAELEVLACLWRNGETTAREVREAMHTYRPMTHGSVATLLSRLQAKGLVTRRKGPVGKAYVYKAVRRPGPAYRRVIKDFVERIFGGNTVALVNSLFETKPPTPDELETLQTLLDELREQDNSGRDDR